MKKPTPKKKAVSVRPAVPGPDAWGVSEVLWVAIVLFLIGLTGWFIGQGIGSWLADKKHSELELPGALVDKAWAVKGAILLTPNRNLVEYGIEKVVPDNPDTIGNADLRVCSPTIAVRTAKKWCLLPLGVKCGMRIVHSDGDLTIYANPEVEIWLGANDSSLEGFLGCVNATHKP